MNKSLKALALVIFTLLSILLYPLNANAGQTGVVDLIKVINKYHKAQTTIQTLRKQNSDLQKFVAKAKNDIKATKNNDEKVKKEKKYNDELRKKSMSLKQKQTKEWQVVQQDILKAIKKVSKEKQIDTIFRKQSIVIGAQDITDDVSVLNKSDTAKKTNVTSNKSTNKTKSTVAQGKTSN